MVLIRTVAFAAGTNGRSPQLSCRSLGFSIEDTALVNTAVPLADILGPPAAGLLADKLGNFGDVG